MGINDLKAKAYELAGVSTTQQLKAKYATIGALNLRLKASWQQAVDFLHTNPVSDRPIDPVSDPRTPAKTIADLKAEVYALAHVSTPQQLKAKYDSLGALNFSFKISWEKALDLLATSQPDFQAWLANPPEEYKALFAEIEMVSENFSNKLETAKQLGQDAHEMAVSLEQLAQSAQTEAISLRQEAENADWVAQKAKLN